MARPWRSRSLAIAALLLVVCLAQFGAAYAGAADPTPSQIVSAIKRAHLEAIAASIPSDASRFVVYGNGDAYGPKPQFEGEHFVLNSVKYLTVNGEHLLLIRYIIGNAAWRDFAFFLGSLNYAGALPLIGPNNRYQSVGRNLIVTLHTLKEGDAYCCPSGPWRTVAVFSANSHGLFTPTQATQTRSVGAISPAHSAGAGAVVQQFYAWYMTKAGKLSAPEPDYHLAPVRRLFDDRFYWLLQQEGVEHPGSKRRYGMECSLDSGTFIPGQMYSRIWSFKIGAPIARGNAIAVPVTLFVGGGPVHGPPGVASKITIIVKNEAGTYKIYDVGDGTRQDLERQAHDPNCAWPKA